MKFPHKPVKFPDHHLCNPHVFLDWVTGTQRGCTRCTWTGVLASHTLCSTLGSVTALVLMLLHCNRVGDSRSLALGVWEVRVLWVNPSAQGWVLGLLRRYP